jgi:hypothetical protein
MGCCHLLLGFLLPFVCLYLAGLVQTTLLGQHSLEHLPLFIAQPVRVLAAIGGLLLELRRRMRGQRRRGARGEHARWVEGH